MTEQRALRVDPYRKAWADLIRSKREALKMTQAELARAVKVTPAAVNMWEHQTATPGPVSQRRLIEALGIVDNELMAVIKKAAA